ncbi:MAG: hypothetical protein JOS17DRAFT_797633 [Linnemannia elongata]|nr:MAG: hypothetical protein JOS17DRAFT_797633 [Linnemannia elongata]
MSAHPLEKPLPLPTDDDHTTFSSALEKDDNLLRSLSISEEKALPALPQVTLNVFPENVPRPAIKTDLPHPRQRIDRTDQLVYCNSLLLLESLALSSSEQKPPLGNNERAWLMEMKKDPMEEDRLQWLAIRMVESFIQDSMKDSTKITEITALGPILQIEPYRKLLSSLIKEFDDSRLLDLDLLQGLVLLVQSTAPGYLVSDDLVRILSILRIRLQGTHQQSSEYPYHLTLAISRGP